MCMALTLTTTLPEHDSVFHICWIAIQHSNMNHSMFVFRLRNFDPSLGSGFNCVKNRANPFIFIAFLSQLKLVLQNSQDCGFKIFTPFSTKIGCGG